MIIGYKLLKILHICSKFFLKIHIKKFIIYNLSFLTEFINAKFKKISPDLNSITESIRPVHLKQCMIMKICD